MVGEEQFKQIRLMHADLEQLLIQVSRLKTKLELLDTQVKIEEKPVEIVDGLTVRTRFYCEVIIKL